MLQIFRNKAQSTFIQVIVVAIALVFIFSFGGNMMNNNEAALVVGNEEISFQQYQQAYEQANQRLADQFGGNVPKGMAEALGLKEQVINQLVQAALLRQGSAEMGLQLSNVEIQQAIQNIPQFAKDGAFDKATYEQVLSANRLSPTKFEDNMRFDMLSSKTNSEIGKFSNSSSPFEINDFYAQVNEGVSVNFVELAPSSYEADIQFSEEDLSKWFEDGAKTKYQASPQRKVSYLNYSFDSVGSKIDIDETAIESYYQSHKEQFSSPEMRHARHILFTVKDEDSQDVRDAKMKQAEDILIRAQNGEDFASLATQFSEGPSKTNGGDLGFFGRGMMIPAFEEATFTLEKGGISDIVTTDFGYHIIKLEEITPATVQTIDQAKDEIILALKKEQAQGLAFQLANNAYEGIIAAGSLANYIAETPDAPLVITDYFSIDNPPQGLDQQFITAAFALKKGELSSLTQTEAGYTIISIDDVQEPIAPQLAEVRDQAAIDYTAFLADQKAKALAEELLVAAQKGELVNQAESMGLEIKTTDFISRQDDTGDFPAALVEQIFTLSLKKTAPENVGTDSGKYYVFSYLGRQDPEVLAGDDEERLRYENAIKMNKRQMLLSAWIAHQQSKVEITRHANL